VTAVEPRSATVEAWRRPLRSARAGHRAQRRSLGQTERRRSGCCSTISMPKSRASRAADVYGGLIAKPPAKPEALQAIVASL